MKHSLMFKNSFSIGTFTVRSCGYKASSTQSMQHAFARLIEKMYGYEPKTFVLEQSDRGEWTGSWDEKEEQK